MAIPGAATTLLGVASKATGGGAPMLGAGIFGPGPQMVAGLLTSGLADLTRRIITGTLHDPAPFGIEEPMSPGDPEGLAWYARHPSSVEAARARDPMALTMSYAWSGGPIVDLITGEVMVPATDPNWQAVWGAKQQPAPTSAPEIPPYIPPESADYGYGSEPTGGYTVPSMSPLSLIGDVVGGIIDIGMKTMPIWSPYLPQPRGPTLQPIPTAPAPPSWTPIQPGGATPVSTLPIAMPGGAPIYLPGATPAVGLPFADIVPTGSIPITPNPVTGNLPSSVLAPYRTRCGAPAWTIYRKMGRPVAYSGDFAAERRVKRLARKAKRRVGGR